MKAIGGFFELEPFKSEDVNNIFFTQNNTIGLTNGRACVTSILKSLKPKKVWVPYYTCYALFEPMEKLGFEYCFYSINEELEIETNIQLNNNDILIYINYFGLKRDYSNFLVNKYGEQIIIDDTHDFFHPGYEKSLSFTSARKYFGVPDGAFLKGNTDKIKVELGRFKETSFDHLILRKLGKQKEAYNKFSTYEKSLGYLDYKISLISEEILKKTPFDKYLIARQDNFNYFHQILKPYNSLSSIIDKASKPSFMYPFLPVKEIKHDYFYSYNIFIPQLWSDILIRNDIDCYKTESRFTTKILPLPIDQRYTLEDLERVTKLILKLF